MTPQEVVDFYVAIPQEQKCFFLFTLAHKLDQVCTDFCKPLHDSDDEGAVRFGGLSELMHQISVKAQRHFAGDADGYPDDVFIRMLLEISESAGIASRFVAAFRAAARSNLKSLYL